MSKGSGKMPGKNCCVPECGVNRRKKFQGISICRVKLPTTDEEKKWRSDILNAITKVRAVDQDFRTQILHNSFRICALHFDKSDLIQCKL